MLVGQDLFCRDDHFELAVVLIPDCRHVLTASYPTGRIVALPEQVNNLGELDLFRIEIDLQGFRIVPQALVRRKTLATAGISDSSPIDSIDRPKLGVRSPKSAKSKSGRVQILRNRLINGRNSESFIRLILNRHQFLQDIYKPI